MSESGVQPPPNRGSVEAAVAEVVRASGVRLLGELDLLDAPCYQEMSLAASADFVMGQIGRLPNPYKPLRMPGYPASLAVWVVAHAQRHPDGKDFWSSLPFPANPAQLGQLFGEALTALGLETFPALFAGKQRHMGLARLHALVPLYAASDVLAQIDRARERGWTAEAVRAHLLQHRLCHDPVQNLLQAVPDVACDLIERLTAAGHFGAAGLQLVPPHLRSSVAAHPPRSRTAGTPSDVVRGRSEQPAVWLEPDAGTLRVYVPAHPRGWSLDIGGRAHEVPAAEAGEWPAELGQVLVTRGDWAESLQLLDPTQQVWAFDLWGRDHGSTLPAAGGLLIVPVGASVEPAEQLSLVYDSMCGPWSAYHAVQVRPGKNLTVSWPDGGRTVLAEKALAISAEPVVGLRTGQGGRVWAQAPRVTTGAVTVLDHLTKTSYTASCDTGSLTPPRAVEVDITIAGRLGLRQHLDGLLIDGLVADGLDRPILPGEQRLVRLCLPEGWSGQTEANLHTTTDRAELTVVAPNGRAHVLLAAPGLVAWSARGDALPRLWDVATLRATPRELQSMSSLVVRVGSLPAGQLQVSVGGRYAFSLSSRLDTGLVSFDVRPVWTVLDTSPGEPIAFRLWLGGQHLTLMLVATPPDPSTKHQMRTVDLSHLPALLGYSPAEMEQARRENSTDAKEAAATLVRQKAVSILLAHTRRHQ